jgi:hypothetical protein
MLRLTRPLVLVGTRISGNFSSASLQTTGLFSYLIAVRWMH